MDAALFLKRPTEYSCGVTHRGSQPGRPLVPKSIAKGDVAFVTTRDPRSASEADRFVIAVYRIGKIEDERIIADSNLDVRIPPSIAPSIDFWSSYTDETGAPASTSGRPDWRMKPYRYLDDRQTKHLLLRIELALGKRPEAGLVHSLLTGAPSPRIHRLPLAPPDALGQPYTPVAAPSSKNHQTTLYARNPEILERGLRGHQLTQNGYADFLRSKGIWPRRPRSDEPDYDLAWQHEGRRYVAEIKSITNDNEEIQLRLGLGQVLRYRDQLAARTPHEIIAVLAPEREPRDQSWHRLCDRLGVLLVWPGAFKCIR